MDYNTINQVMEEIILIVNNYNKSKGYSVSVCEKLALALLGYYLVFGVSIFSKINIILDSLCILECETKDKYMEALVRINENIKDDTLAMRYNPVTVWDYKYDNNKKFRGAIPYIVYVESSKISDVFNVIHELSHTLDGLSASVEAEDEDLLTIKQSFARVLVKKINNSSRIEEQGFTELITISVENRTLQEFLKLDEDKVSSPLLKDFLTGLKSYRERNVLCNSYGIMAACFKDLIDNDEFINLIAKYYYDNNEELFEEEFNSYDRNLSYRQVKNCAIHLAHGGMSEVFYYSNILKEQIALFSKATKFESDNRMLILV